MVQQFYMSSWVIFAASVSRIVREPDRQTNAGENRTPAPATVVGVGN